MHRDFLHNYPDHKRIDQASLADFLTALCIYDEILLDSSSSRKDKEPEAEGCGQGGRLDESKSWVEQLKGLLPQHVSALIRTSEFGGVHTIDEKESCSKAFDVISSPLKKDILLEHGEKIPNVYFAKDYVYRAIFEKLNKDSGYILNSEELAQAMFLHRGLFLQSRAHEQRCVYMPYYYRGKVLSKLPPTTWVRAPCDGLATARLPLAEDSRPNETDYIKTLNSYYYTILKSVTWTTYCTNVPFVGAAILASTGGDPRDAIEVAMDYRMKGVLRNRFAKLNAAIQESDRPRFESLLTEYRSELEAAARHFGAETQGDLHKTFYELAVCWMPRPAASVITAAVQLLPEYVRHWVYEASSTLITKTPLQLLFIEHVSAIRKKRLTRKRA